MDVRRPVDPISQGLSRAEKGGKRPQQLVRAKDLVPVVGRTDVVHAPEHFPLLVQILDRRLVSRNQEQMELHEASKQHCDQAINDIGHLNDGVLKEKLLATRRRREIVRVQFPDDRLQEIVAHYQGDKVGRDEDVDEEEDEVLAVPEADAVVDPGAVVVHVEDAAVAG